jgi:glycosyltransferase involved in cell wall biosynthesis
LDQEYPGLEVIVVEDGSADNEHSRYHSLVEKTSGLAKLISLPRTDCGHGPSYGRNRGSFLATGDYLCFLDDDDEWTDPGHLGRVAEVIADSSKQPQLILANQKAYRNGVPLAGSVWIEDLADRLKEKTNPSGTYTVMAAELLTCSAHCHVNSMVVLRSFFVNLSGFDDSLRYEEDRDFYLRAIDRADTIKYLPFTVARHNVPDSATGASISTRLSELSKRIDQLRVFDKAILLSTRLEVRRYAMRQRAYILKHIATEAAHMGHMEAAAYYARQAWIAKASLRWLIATGLFDGRRSGVWRSRS